MSEHCPICGISESIPSPDHDHAANFVQSVCDDCNRSTSGRCWRHGQLHYSTTPAIPPSRSLPAERDEPTGQEVVEANVSAFLDLQRLRQAAEDWRYSDELIGSRFRAWVAATRERNGQ